MTNLAMNKLHDELCNCSMDMEYEEIMSIIVKTAVADGTSEADICSFLYSKYRTDTSCVNGVYIVELWVGYNEDGDDIYETLLCV